MPGRWNSTFKDKEPSVAEAGYKEGRIVDAVRAVNRNQ